MTLQESLDAWRSTCPAKPEPCSLAQSENAIEGRTDFVDELLEAGWTPPAELEADLLVDSQLLNEPWGMVERDGESTCA